MINWARFSGRELIKRLASRLFMPEVTFNEVKGPVARSLAAQWLTERFLTLTPSTSLDEAEIVNVLSLIASHPDLPSIDPPELYAFSLARRLKAPLLTDNKAPKRLVEAVAEYGGVEVLDSLDVLVKVEPDRVKLKELVKRFMSDTSFKFSSRRLEELGV